MKNTNLVKGTAIVTAIATLFVAIPAMAQVNGNNSGKPPRAMMQQERPNQRFASTTMMGTTSAQFRMEEREERRASSTQVRLNNQQDRGSFMIDQRIESLNRLIARIEAMKHIGSTDQSSLEASLKAEIAALLNLKAQIATGTSTVDVRSDISSITKSYRVYALVEPQAQITAAADRILSIVDSMNIIYAKIQARLASSTSSATSTSSYLSDFLTQINTASTQAKLAISLVSNLKPDNGDASIASSSRATLQAARQNVVTAQKALNASEKDLRFAVGVISHNKKSLNGLRAPVATSTNPAPVATTTSTTTP
ncbi:MAG TPA: hypothetical protein VL335_00840 [Candidatus Paceibacterota bacterium]|nr:hypothetical protein [Candidatus Paceibacterota bacterium]